MKYLCFYSNLGLPWTSKTCLGKTPTFTQVFYGVGVLTVFRPASNFRLRRSLFLFCLTIIFFYPLKKAFESILPASWFDQLMSRVECSKITPWFDFSCYSTLPQKRKILNRSSSFLRQRSLLCLPLPEWIFTSWKIAKNNWKQRSLFSYDSSHCLFFCFVVGRHTKCRFSDSFSLNLNAQNVI